MHSTGDTVLLGHRETNREKERERRDKKKRKEKKYTRRNNSSRCSRFPWPWQTITTDYRLHVEERRPRSTIDHVSGGLASRIPTAIIYLYWPAGQFVHTWWNCSRVYRLGVERGHPMPTNLGGPCRHGQRCLPCASYYLTPPVHSTSRRRSMYRETDAATLHPSKRAPRMDSGVRGLCCSTSLSGRITDSGPRLMAVLPSTRQGRCVFILPCRRLSLSG